METIDRCTGGDLSQGNDVEVLVLGLCRTGTLSMKIALEELGYGQVYHFTSVFEHESRPKLWIDAIQKKFSQNEQTQREFQIEEWQDLFQGFNAITDIPSACFAPELIKAYPKAKLILTTRSESSWHKSMLHTIHALQSSRFHRLTMFFQSKHTKSISHLTDLIIKYYFNDSIPIYGKDIFRQHNQMVKDIAAQEGRDVLEFRVGEGWEKLCVFLGNEVPDKHFPFVNDTKAFRKGFGVGWYGIRPMATGVLALVMGISVLAALR